MSDPTYRNVDSLASTELPVWYDMAPNMWPRNVDPFFPSSYTSSLTPSLSLNRRTTFASFRGTETKTKPARYNEIAWRLSSKLTNTMVFRSVGDTKRRDRYTKRRRQHGAASTRARFYSSRGMAYLELGSSAFRPAVFRLFLSLASSLPCFPSLSFALSLGSVLASEVHHPPVLFSAGSASVRESEATGCL